MSFFVCPFSCVFAASTAICLHKLARFGMKFSLLYLETHANTSHTTKPTFFIFIIMFIEYKQNDPLWAHLFATSHMWRNSAANCVMLKIPTRSLHSWVGRDGSQWTHRTKRSKDTCCLDRKKWHSNAKSRDVVRHYINELEQLSDSISLLIPRGTKIICYLTLDDWNVFGLLVDSHLSLDRV